MKKVKQGVQQWVRENIQVEPLSVSCRDTIEYFRRAEEPNENNEYSVWAQEIVNGAHGQYAMQIFNKEVAGIKVEGYEGLSNVEESVISFDAISRELAVQLNACTNMPGVFTVGYHEADNSIGIYYTEKA